MLFFVEWHARNLAELLLLPLLLLLLLLPTVKTSFTRKKLVAVALVSNKSIQECNTSRSN